MRKAIYLLTAPLLFAAIGCREDRPKQIPITTSSEKARTAYLKARDLMDHAHIAEARPLLDEAISQDSQFAMALLLRAETASSNKEYFERIKTATAAAAKATEPEQMLIRASEAGANGSSKERGEILAKLVAAWPEDERARALLGNHLYFGQRQYNEAVKEFRKAIELNPVFAPAYNMLGYSLRETGNHKEAEAALRKYVELVPNEANAFDSLAELLLETRRLEESVSLYQKATIIDPKFTNAYRGMASGLVFLDRHKAAMEQLQKMYEVSQDDGERHRALRAMAACLAEDGRIEDALSALARSESLAASTSDHVARAASANSRGLLFLETGKPEQAKAQFILAIGYMRQSALPERNRKVWEAGHHGQLALVASAKRQFTLARKEAETMRAAMEGMEGPQSRFWMHETLGVVALGEKKYDEALTELKQSDPKSSYAMFYTGRAYAGKNDIEQAMAWYKKAATSYRLLQLDDAFGRRAAQRALGS